MRLENLLLTNEGAVKLAYFGLTTQAECYSKKKTDCKGMHYFAPEVIAGKYDMKSDLWSLGIALMECVSRKKSNVNSKENTALPDQESNSDPFIQNDNFSDEYNDFIRKCLMKDGNERWSASQLMKVIRLLYE